MKNCSTTTGTILVLVSGLLLFTASAADRPVKKNKDYVPHAVAASAFPFVTSGMVAKIKTASIAKDGTIAARFRSAIKPMSDDVTKAIEAELAK